VNDDEWPWHAGEREVQERTGGGTNGGAIRPQMSTQHRRFYEGLPFALIGTLDRGYPVATLWSGSPGFITAPDPVTLQIAAPLDPLDPTSRAFTPGAPFGLLGIELATRRRNRSNGVVAAVDPSGVRLAIRQSFGNCPQYILPRQVKPAAAGTVAAELLGRLDPEARAAIGHADTFFVATSARTDEVTGGVDMSHRGGPPGFIRIDGDTLTIPDFPGNHYFNTLGNLMSDPRAALLFVDFTTGDVLHVQGTTEIQWDGPEVAALAGAERLWRVHVERGWRRRAALALRWTALARWA
jgi:hypothetical protein